MMDKLLPCPFCGGEAILESNKLRYGTIYSAYCQKCGAEITGFSEHEAIAAWNRRADDERLKTTLKEIVQLACKSVEREKALARLEAEVMVWAKAERDGRLVVLPCKVGDTVYAIVHCDGVMKDCDDDYVTGTGAITCPFEGSCTFEECDESNKILAETCVSGLWCESDETWKVFLEHITADIGVADFGKTVFLTREAAEAALKEQTNGTL